MRFQYLKGAIQSRLPRRDRRRLNPFQYLKGAIQSWVAQGVVSVDRVAFNTSKVRFRDSHDPNCAEVNHLSIPQRCDSEATPRGRVHRYVSLSIPQRCDSELGLSLDRTEDQDFQYLKGAIQSGSNVDDAWRLLTFNTSKVRFREIRVLTASNYCRTFNTAKVRFRATLTKSRW